MDARDTEIAISFWKEKAEQFGNPPPLGEFSLIDLGVDPFCFLVVADLLARDASVFLAYGTGFDQVIRPA